MPACQEGSLQAEEVMDSQGTARAEKQTNTDREIPLSALSRYIRG